MTGNDSAEGILRVGVLVFYAFFPLAFMGCCSHCQVAKRDVSPVNERDRRELVSQILGEFECETSLLGRQNIGFSMILDSGWPAIEVLHANLNNTTSAVGVPYIFTRDDDGTHRLLTIGEVCDELLQDIIKPKNMRHRWSYKKVDWDEWIKAHRGMTIEEIRRQWRED